jgi:hypothetical protein
MLALLLTGLAGAQTRPSQTTGRGGELLDIVEVVGCLTGGPDGTWLLTRATAPAVERAPFSNPEAMKTAATKALGTQRVRLINFTVFKPEDHKGHKMVARGLWIQDAKDPRLNLTSLLMLDATCAK